LLFALALPNMPAKSRLLDAHLDAHRVGCPLAVDRQIRRVAPRTFPRLSLRPPCRKIPVPDSLISRNNSQSFVPGYRRISSHGLIVYEHSSIHSAAPNQISHQIRNVCLAITPAVLRPHDPPATFVLRANVSAQQRGAHHDYCQYCRTLN
jgi:hypothetical protein